jgi:hypothetical protein
MALLILESSVALLEEILLLNHLFDAVQ